MTTESAYGLWWAPSDASNKASGVLEWDPLRRLRLKLLDPPPGMWAGVDLASGQSFALGDNRVPILHGLTDKGGLTLFDCFFGGMAYGVAQQITLTVGRAASGVHADAHDESFIRRVEVDLPALGVLLGPQPVTTPRFPARRARTMKVNLDARRFSWQDGEVSVVWEYRPTWSMARTDIAVGMQPIVELTSSTPKSLPYWIEEWLVPINELMTIATGHSSNPKSVLLWPKKNMTKQERWQQMLTLWGQGIGDHDYQPKDADSLIRAPAIDLNPGGLPDVLARSRALACTQEIFLDLLRDVINSSDRPVRNRYLDLTSALEAYHSQLHGVGPSDPTTFKRKRKDVVNNVKASSADASTKRFVSRWLARRSTYSLEDRLRTLAARVGVLAQWKLDPHRLGALRNDVAHGNTGLAMSDVSDGYDQLLDLARRLVIDDLGIVSPNASGASSTGATP